MGELWQGLTMNPESPQMAPPQGGGYASGGAVDPGMSIYDQTMRDLESGGVGGYAEGGRVHEDPAMAAEGRNGDSMLMHIQPEELAGLESLLGPTTTNPNTGNPEAFVWGPVIAGMILGGALGGVSASAQGGNAGDIALGAVGGGVLGGITGGIAGAGVAPAAVAAPTAGGSLAATVPIAGAGTGGMALNAAGTGLVAAPLNYGGAASFASMAAPALMGSGAEAGGSMPPPPQMSTPTPRSGPLVSPNQSRRQPMGIASLQRPPSGMRSGRIGNSLRGRGIA